MLRFIVDNKCSDPLIIHGCEQIIKLNSKDVTKAVGIIVIIALMMAVEALLWTCYLCIFKKTGNMGSFRMNRRPSLRNNNPSSNA